MPKYLIAHVNLKNTGIAQTKIDSKSESSAIALFSELYPERVVTVVGVHGVEKK